MTLKHQLRYFECVSLDTFRLTYVQSALSLPFKPLHLCKVELQQRRMRDTSDPNGDPSATDQLNQSASSTRSHVTEALTQSQVSTQSRDRKNDSDWLAHFILHREHLKIFLKTGFYKTALNHQLRCFKCVSRCLFIYHAFRVC